MSKNSRILDLFQWVTVPEKWRFWRGHHTNTDVVNTQRTSACYSGLDPKPAFPYNSRASSLKPCVAMTTKPPATPKDAATVLLLRASTPFEIFMVRRHGRSKFMGGMYVFPGGKRDDSDNAVDHTRLCHGPSPNEAAQRMDPQMGADRALGLYIAAIRETFEEAGILLAVDIQGAPIDGAQHAETLATARQALQNNEKTLFDVLESNQWRLNLAALRYYSHWVTPEVEPRRYSARFFVAHAPANQAGQHDSHETTDSLWISPKDALQQYEDGVFECAPPTLRVLEQMSEHPSVEQALSSAKNEPCRPNAPQFAQDGDTMCLVLPGDPLHPYEPGLGRRRFALENFRWRTIIDDASPP